MKYRNLLFFFLLIVAAGCRKTEEFYNQLDQLPRINKLSSTAYAVGDTLTLTGKFGAGKATLKITIGGVEAPVLSLTTQDSSYIEKEVLYNYTVDQVKMLITEPMIGRQQAVVVTVNGVSSTVATILIARERPVPARTDTLSYQDPAIAKLALTMPAGTRVVPNYTPGGAIVFLNGDSVVTWQEGVIRRGKVTWADSYGAFSILGAATNVSYGIASDPAGNNLYISCLTRDALLPGTTYSATRLLKISLQDYSLTTLNRTVIPTNVGYIDNALLDLDTAKREGNIRQVFLPVMKNLYLNRAGDLYFSNPSFNWVVPASGTSASSPVGSNLAVGRIDASGTLQYLAKGSTTVNKIFVVRIRKNGVVNNSTYDFIPNVTTVFNYNRLMSIDAENNLLYAYTGTSPNVFNIAAFYCYNLAQQRQAGEFTYKPVSSWAPSITDGPFDVVEGRYFELANRYHVWPSPGQPMVIFAMQHQLQELGKPDDVWPNHQLHSVKMINFSTRTVSTYAPYIQAYTNTLPPPATHPGYTFYSKYRLGLGGDVIGYTAAQQPVMILTKYLDPSINEVRLLVPVK